MINKLINSMVKIAGVIITAPVTWLVAGQLFGDVQPAWLRVIVQASALLVVEGVFITNWIALDSDRGAVPEIKARYALTSGGMYCGLWILALWHGEGVAGLVFRLALGGALIGSMYDAGIHTMLKRDREADRDILKDWRVARHARNLARQNAIAELDTQQDIKRQERESRLAIESARIALDKQGGLAAVKAEYRASIEASRPGYPMPISEARTIRDEKRARTKAKAKETILRVIGINPAIKQDELAAMTHRSRQSVGVYLGELTGEGKLIRTPAGEYKLAPAPVIIGESAGGNGNGNR